MKTKLALACLLGTLLAGGAAHAQAPAQAAAQTPPQAGAWGTGAPVGKQAGSFMVRLRAIGVLPQDSASSVSAIGGHVEASNQAAPELDLSYFITDHIAVEAIAASTRHEIAASGTALGHVDVGSVHVLPPTVTLQYHFMPHERFSPYLGAGVTIAWFYDSNPAGPAISRFGIGTSAGAAIQAGFDYNLTGHWFANFDVKQIFMNVDARINGGAIIAKTALDPTIIGAGIGYRF
jgi:outer membrane protein